MTGNRSDTLGVGDPGPDFTLPAADGTDVHLAAYRGTSPLILYFFRGTW